MEIQHLMWSAWPLRCFKFPDVKACFGLQLYLKNCILLFLIYSPWLHILLTKWWGDWCVATPWCAQVLRENQNFLTAQPWMLSVVAGDTLLLPAAFCIFWGKVWTAGADQAQLHPCLAHAFSVVRVCPFWDCVDIWVWSVKQKVFPALTRSHFYLHISCLHSWRWAPLREQDIRWRCLTITRSLYLIFIPFCRQPRM